MVSRVKKSGVYKIFNEVNGKFYIGSSKDIVGRLSKHRTDLKANKHHNRHLQNAWNMYGEKAFIFSILEECSSEREVLLETEQSYIDLYLPEYNILPIAGSPMGTKQTDEHKQKISSSNKGRTFTEIHKLRIKEARKMQIISKHSEDAKLKMSIKASQRTIPDNIRKQISETQKGKVKEKNVTRIFDKKEMNIAHFIQWLHRTK